MMKSHRVQNLRKEASELPQILVHYSSTMILAILLMADGLTRNHLTNNGFGI